MILKERQIGVKMKIRKIERLDISGKILDNTTSVIFAKQDEIITKINKIIEWINNHGHI